MRVVFLDFDGVCNSLEYIWRQERKELRFQRRWSPADDLDPALIERLNGLLARTGAKVVVSASVRKLCSIEYLRSCLHARGFVGTVLGKTAESGPRRGHEIAAWLEARPFVTAFVILDDDSDMAHLMPRLVRTDLKVGLSATDVERAVALFETDGTMPSGPPTGAATLIYGDAAIDARDVPLSEQGQSVVRVQIDGRAWAFSRRSGQALGRARDGWQLASHRLPAAPTPWRPQSERFGGGE